MSKLTRVLVVGVMMAAINLAGIAAVAQAQSAHDDAVQRFRQGEQASQEQPTTADPTQQELTARWNDYHYQATRMSRAQHKTWMPAWRRVDNPTSPPALAPGPVQPAGPSGQPGWLLIALGVLALVAGLAMLATRHATRRARFGPAT
jgi:hypothetical protein